MSTDRENEINNLKPEEYWTIGTTFIKGKESFQGKFYGIDGKKKDLPNKSEVDKIVAQLTDDTFTIDKVNRKERKRNPAKPFITSTLQQEAARKINFRARKTMMVAQQLYEGIDLGKKAGAITGRSTYMRPDSTRIASSAKKDAAQYIEHNSGTEYLGKKGQ